ncbi:Transmembrane protein 87B [Dirofilaria immitis]|nr:Transmembrane protein 87B [Dirofilaria immitis]
MYLLNVSDTIRKFLMMHIVNALEVYKQEASKAALSPAILSTKLQLKADTIEYVGFPQSALNGTEVEIRLRCSDDSDLTFQVQYVIRSSPCDKEFFDASRRVQNFYFEHEWEIPPEYDYTKFLFYKSRVQQFNCRQSHGILLVQEDEHPRRRLEIHDVKQARSKYSNISSTTISNTEKDQYIIGHRQIEIRFKREFAGLNDDSLDGGTKTTLSSWHPVQKLPADGIYFLVIKFVVVKYNSFGKTTEVPFVYNLIVDVQWRSPYGHLSAIDYPLLKFYAFMWLLYTMLAVIWQVDSFCSALICCLCYWKDILRIQFCIGKIFNISYTDCNSDEDLGTVIVAGMIEKGMFYSEYAAMNEEGFTIHGFIEVAELVSCLKRTMARILIIIVSLGYGVVKPRLGSTISQVIGVGFIYFIFSAIEAMARVSKNQVQGMKQKQLAALPLVLVEVVIFWWIFTSLISTMRVLRMRRNMIKLSVYRHFTNALCFSAFISIIFMCWTIYIHNMQQCLVDWKEYWVDTAFWHIQFCCILVVIMVLWRPSRNNQRYAFTPLLDDSEDENDDDELFNTNYYAMAGLNKRTATVGTYAFTRDEKSSTNRKQHEAQESDQKLQEELKWIEDNIPSTFADHLLIDDEEDKEQMKLELSKML